MYSNNVYTADSTRKRIIVMGDNNGRFDTCYFTPRLYTSSVLSKEVTFPDFESFRTFHALKMSIECVGLDMRVYSWTMRFYPKGLCKIINLPLKVLNKINLVILVCFLQGYTKTQEDISEQLDYPLHIRRM